MSIDLKAMSQKELNALKKKIDAALDRTILKEKKAARTAVEKAAKAHGFSLEELFTSKPVEQPGRKPTSKSKKASATAKFANPADESQTWTGKGRQPGWFKEAVASGRKPSDLRI